MQGAIRVLAAGTISLLILAGCLNFTEQAKPQAGSIAAAALKVLLVPELCADNSLLVRCFGVSSAVCTADSLAALDRCSARQPELSGSDSRTAGLLGSCLMAEVYSTHGHKLKQTQECLYPNSEKLAALERTGPPPRIS